MTCRDGGCHLHAHVPLQVLSLLVLCRSSCCRKEPQDWRHPKLDWRHPKLATEESIAMYAACRSLFWTSSCIMRQHSSSSSRCHRQRRAQRAPAHQACPKVGSQQRKGRRPWLPLTPCWWASLQPCGASTGTLWPIQRPCCALWSPRAPPRSRCRRWWLQQWPLPRRRRRTKQRSESRRRMMVLVACTLLVAC